MTTNPSGFAPLDTRVVVLPDSVEEKTAGGIIIPDASRDKQKYATVRATVLAVGQNAGLEWGEEARKPMPGDRILMAQYAGMRAKGDDGVEYTILNDEDVVAVLEDVQ